MSHKGSQSTTLVHTWNAVDVSACNSIPGANWNVPDCQSTFLKNAVEISGDGIGNDNVLCESGETCLFTPNMGAYQGDGALISTGTFDNTGNVNGDPVVTGVTLLEYTNHGVN